jgi:ribosome-associated protein
MDINATMHIPEIELIWSYVRSSGPGGQNVNKVATKAVLRWDLKNNSSLPVDVKQRLRIQQRRRLTNEDELIITSQRYRDQERNREDCLEKLREAVLRAMIVPKPRKVTRPSRGSRERRLQAKRHRAGTKAMRRGPREE